MVDNSRMIVISNGTIGRPTWSVAWNVLSLFLYIAKLSAEDGTLRSTHVRSLFAQMTTSSEDDWGDARSAGPDHSSDDWNVAAPAPSQLDAPRGAGDDDDDDDWNAIQPHSAGGVMALGRSGLAPGQAAAHGGGALPDSARLVAQARALQVSSMISSTVSDFFVSGASQYTTTLAAMKAGVSRRSVVRRIWVSAWTVYTAARYLTNSVIRALLGTCGVRWAGADLLENRQPLVLIRKRKYDETQIPLVVDSENKSLRGGEFEFETGDKFCSKQRILVLEGAFAVVVKRTTPHGTTFLRMAGSWPCLLQCIERNNGECLRKSFDEWNLEDLVYFQRRFPRMVDLHIHDECSANLRAERSLATSCAEGLGSHASLELLCDAHKKAQAQAGPSIRE